MNMTQSQFMRLYNDTHREDFNPVLFQRSNQDIMDCMKKVILSCERDKYFTLKVMDMKEIYDYEEIINLLRDYEEKKNKKKAKSPKENIYDYIDVKDSDIMLLEVKYLIRHNGVELNQDNNELLINPWEILTVLIVLPRFTKKYYFRLNGNYYSDIFQIVDGSTYNNITGGKNKKNQCNTFKTIFTPIKMYKLHRDLVDVSGETVRHTVFVTNINMVFNTFSNCMYFLLANFGYYTCCDFLDIHCIQINNAPIDDKNYYNFQRNGIYVSYPKHCYPDPMVQALAATLVESITNDTKLEDMFDIRHWLITLGAAFKNPSIDKGLFILDALDGTYDIITKEQIHLPDDMKADIYQILRWLMREFMYIRGKNNVDVSLKRYRIGEPIAAVYARKLITGLSRCADMGKKVTLHSVHKHINTAPMYVINNIINMSNLIAYRDLVNDNDGMTALKFTYKGISGLGENGTSIQQSYRYVDSSHAGILDLDSSTTSDPGMSGTICPLATVYSDNSFSQYSEPNYWEKENKHFQDEWKKKECPNAVEPFEFEKPFEPDWNINRREVFEQNLNIEGVICPFYNVNDPKIDYSNAGMQLLKEYEEESNVKSMFTINYDDDTDDEEEYLDPLYEED